MNAVHGRKKRVILFAEAVTMAHVARPLCFARALDPDIYQIAIAASPRVAGLIAAEGCEHVALDSIEPQAFLDALASGRALYDAATLQRYVDNDRAVIDRFAPDLIVGDFRLSLSVSARLAGIPYVSICSAYWSPFYAPPRWPVPALPLTRLLPLGAAQLLFDLVRPIAFAAHCRPLNRVRQANGLPPLPSDLRVVYTDADFVVYSDTPGIFPAILPATHRFIGPALWQPRAAVPEWWTQLQADRPCVYLTLGSSGEAALLRPIVDALAALPIELVVARAGAALPERTPANVHHAPYLPGLEAAGRAQLVVCNGGNLTAYQALAGGTPVLGIAGNLDQFLSMQGFEGAGCAQTLRADRFDAAALRQIVESMLGDSKWRAAAAAARADGAEYRFETGASAVAHELAG